MRRILLIAMILACASAGLLVAHAENWPNWRGPSSNIVSGELSIWALDRTKGDGFISSKTQVTEYSIC